MGAWTDIRFPTYQEAAMNCTEEFIAKMKQKDIVINFVQAWRNDTLGGAQKIEVEYKPVTDSTEK